MLASPLIPFSLSAERVSRDVALDARHGRWVVFGNQDVALGTRCESWMVVRNGGMAFRASWGAGVWHCEPDVRVGW